MMRASSEPVPYTSRGTLSDTILAFSIENNDESGTNVLPDLFQERNRPIPSLGTIAPRSTPPRYAGHLNGWSTIRHILSGERPAGSFREAVYERKRRAVEGARRFCRG